MDTNYDRAGNGHINGKPIRLEKATDGYLLVELKPVEANGDQKAA